jgi:methyl-accepting chemotaxis protein
MVKNRCKNGDHYWVRATVAPVVEGGEITGYVSVRRAPTRNQIAEAEKFYRELQQSERQIVSKFERLKVKNWSMKGRLQAAIQIPLLIILTVAQLFIINALEDDALRAALERGEHTSNQIIDSSNMLMVTGQIGEASNRTLLLKKASSSGQIKSAQMIRSDQLVAQYGVGLPEESVTDNLQRNVMMSGKQSISVMRDAVGGPVMRIITPYLASKDFHGTDCTVCHALAEPGVIGASDLTIDLNPDFARVHEMKLAGWAGQLGFQLFLYFFIAFIVDRFIRRPMKVVGKEFSNIMEGNLETEMDISIQDEMGKMLCDIQTMQTYLRTMVDEIVTPVASMQIQIKQVGDQVAGVASNATTEQDHIQSISATMEQFSQSIVEVANMAAESLDDARNTLKIVEHNNSRMESSVIATSKVAETVQTSSRTITDLGDSIQKIGAIANVIKDIAEQTNLLALNAAIEAARAGEQGRGFAVVADEVRKLAERTSSSTKDIAKTIKEITAISNAAVTSMQEAVTEVDASIGLIRENGEGLKRVVGATENMAQRVEHIADAAKEQSAAGENVAASLERIMTLVDKNTRSAKDTKDATDNMTKAAEELSKAGYPLTKCAVKK